MKNTFKYSALLASTFLASAFTTLAHAEAAGSWLVKAGAMSIRPDVKSGNLSAPSLPGTTVDVSHDTQFGGGIAYMITDNWAVEIPVATPFTFDLEGTGAVQGVGKVGEVKALPLTVFGQYRFLPPESRFHPYAGLGLTYAYFYDEVGNGSLTAITDPGGPGTTLSVDSKLALTPQLGVTLALTDRVFAEAMVAKTFLKTTTSMSSGQKIETTLDPLTVGLYLGYRF